MLTAELMSRELKRNSRNPCFAPTESGNCGLFSLNSPLRFLAAFALEDLAVFHHELHASQGFDILQRIAAHRDDVGKGSGRNDAEFPIHVQHNSCA